MIDAAGSTATRQLFAPAMTIDGDLVRAAESLDVVNPADGERCGISPLCTPEHLDQAFAAAGRALAAWSASAKKREHALLAAAHAIENHAEELGLILATELGRPLPETVGEAASVATRLRYYATMRTPETVIADDATRVVRVVHRPVGVVVAITPWNGPLGTLAMKMAPALSAGNTMVVKPSPLAPLSTLRVGEVLRDALPQGVFNVVAGDDSLGPLASTHPAARMVTFSGSITVGKRIAETSGSDLKRMVLELGGNDAAVVLGDVDVPAAAQSMFRAAFGACGQACVALKRVYAVPEVYDALVDALADCARSAIVGDPLDPGTQIGPLTTAAFRDRIDSLVQDAVAHGAQVVAGGHVIDGPGYYYEPTILADATDGMRVVDEEQFGPVLPVVRCSDADDGVRRANATQFGLSASVWSADAARARSIADELEAGTVWINTHRMNIGPEQPIAGWKWSGIGIENGTWGLESFTDLQTVYEQRV